MIHHLRDRAADPNGLRAKRQMTRGGLARTDFAPYKKLAVPVSGMKSQDIECGCVHVSRQLWTDLSAYQRSIDPLDPQGNSESHAILRAHHLRDVPFTSRVFHEVGDRSRPMASFLPPATSISPRPLSVITYSAAWPPCQSSTVPPAVRWSSAAATCVSLETSAGLPGVNFSSTSSACV